MTKLNCKIIKGYIEGFYGKLLSWDDRRRIIIKLKKCKMNSYLYAPKEDEFHRKNWRLPYKKKWEKEFKEFSINANKNNIDIFVGISPGLDFDFNNLDISNKKSDLFLLFKKCQQMMKIGAKKIVLLLDDIPNDFNIKYANNSSEGKKHGELANKLSSILKQDIFVVPRVYADELIVESKDYLLDFGLEIKKTLIILYCGKNVIEKRINTQSLKNISTFTKNKIVFWDNFYANDYCPRRFFIGPWLNRSNKFDIMINPTGLIETDLLIIEIVAEAMQKSKNKGWEKILIKKGIPKEFLYIKKYFLEPNFLNNPNLKNVNHIIKDIENLDFLIWKWKCKIALEWYPYLLGLKQDLQLIIGVFNRERIIKTQTNPLASLILKTKENNQS